MSFPHLFSHSHFSVSSSAYGQVEPEVCSAGLKVTEEVQCDYKKGPFVDARLLCSTT